MSNAVRKYAQVHITGFQVSSGLDNNMIQVSKTWSAKHCFKIWYQVYSHSAIKVFLAFQNEH